MISYVALQSLPELGHNLLAHCTASFCLALTLVDARRNTSACILPLEPPPHALELAAVTLRPQAQHPPGQAPAHKRCREQTLAPRVPKDPAEDGTDDGAGPLEEGEVEGDGVAVGLVGEGEARDGPVIVGGRGGNAVLVHVRDHGVVLGEDGEDYGRGAGGHVVGKAGSERAQDYHGEGWDCRCEEVGDG